MPTERQLFDDVTYNEDSMTSWELWQAARAEILESNRQLVDQRDELLSALKEMVEFFQPNAWGSYDNQRDALKAAWAAIAKCEAKP